MLEHETRLLVVDRETDEYLRSLRLTCTEDMAVRINPSASSSSPPSTLSKQENNSVSKLPTGREIPKPSRRSPSRATKKVHLLSLYRVICVAVLLGDLFGFFVSSCFPSVFPGKYEFSLWGVLFGFQHLCCVNHCDSKEESSA